MKHLSIYFPLVIILFICSCGQTNSKDFAAVRQSFSTPTDSSKIGVYWYWINDNISKEGVVKDLHAMKQVGINRAFIGNIGGQSGPSGKIKIFTDEWWEVMHTALKTASELDIEIGIFNCPGWSQSGGPWIQPNQAMRYLASSEIRVKGPVKFSQKLKAPVPFSSYKDQDYFEDIKLLAYPVPADYDKNLLELPGVKIKAPANYELPSPESTIDIVLPKPASARSLVIYPARNGQADCELQAKIGNAFKTIRKFTIDRSNTALNVGFEPTAPVAISFPETNSAEFRLLFSKTSNGHKLSKIVLSATPYTERYAEKSLAKMFPQPLPYWDYYLWDKQSKVNDAAFLIDPQKVQDISKNLAADGTLTWDVPEGEWIIMRTGMRTTNVTNAPATEAGTGLEVDKLSKKHIKSHFDAFLGEIIKRIPAADRRSFKVIVEDSYETGSQNFTDGFLDEFKARYGYDATPYLPVFKGYTIGNPDISDRFLWDVRRLVADKVAYDYVAGLREAGQPYGLTTWLENYGHWGFPGEFLQYGGQSDEIGGEFWSEGSLGNIENRAASSCAHIYGKTKVWAESFTCGGGPYSRFPAQMKRRGDWSFTEGINNTLLHVYIQQPYENQFPGVDAGFGNEFNRKNTWFNQMDMFIQYLKRCNFMLQQGLNVADVAYFIGEDAPKMTGVRDPELPKGYSFDYINGEVILRDLTVKDGRLVLPHGTSYSMLVLPKLETMRPEILQKIAQLVAEGAVILGPPPAYSPSLQRYPESDKQIQSLAKEMWGDLSVKQRKYGKGTILTDTSMEEAFKILNLAPDCRFADNDPTLYVHRTVNGKEIYFITNQSDKTIQIQSQFRVNGLQAELWDATTGKTRILPAFEQKGEITTVPLQLEAYESAFVVFSEKGKPSGKGLDANYPKFDELADLTSAWKVNFESDEFKRGPSEAITFTQLQDWSKNTDARIRYFSGTAVYQNNVKIDNIPSGKKVYIDLGKVSVIAKVKVNGKFAGGAWTAPYRVDITDFVKKGENAIEVEVSNTWINRLTGDAQLPEEARKVQSAVSSYKEDASLQTSGLLGPVKVLSR
jgi:hypothetical protein